MTKLAQYLLGPPRLWALVTVVLVLSGCPKEVVPPVEDGGFFLNLVECPHDWMGHVRNQDSLVEAGSFVLPGATTNVPEFHDCQKLVAVTGNEWSYLEIAAVFGAFDLAARWDSVEANAAPESTLADTARTTRFNGDPAAAASLESVLTPPLHTSASETSPSARSAWGILEIVSEGTYAPLGIGVGFNCAFLYSAGTVLQVRMIHYPGQQEPDCRLAADPDTLGGAVLSVTRTTSSRFSEVNDYPAAARWDWDPEKRIQYIGVRCGAGWCEIGPGGFHRSMLPPQAAGLNVAAARVQAIKGWFDQQRLAPPAVTDPASPDPGWGTVFPDPGLGTRTSPDFEDTWLLVAQVAIDSSLEGYGAKLNLHPARSDGIMNRIYLCKGTFARCRASADGTPAIAGRVPTAATEPKCPTDVVGVLPEDAESWWAAILPPEGDVGFRCVIRRDHAAALTALGLTLPGSARWRWRNHDETIWTRCDLGCCEVEGLGG